MKTDNILDGDQLSGLHQPLCGTVSKENGVVISRDFKEKLEEAIDAGNAGVRLHRQ